MKADIIMAAWFESLNHKSKKKYEASHDIVCLLDVNNHSTFVMVVCHKTYLGLKPLCSVSTTLHYYTIRWKKNFVHFKTRARDILHYISKY